jgi:hypothetical protein
MRFRVNTWLVGAIDQIGTVSLIAKQFEFDQIVKSSKQRDCIRLRGIKTW